MKQHVEAIIDYVGNNMIYIALSDMDMPHTDSPANTIEEYIEQYLNGMATGMYETGKMPGAVPVVRSWKIVDD